MDSTRMTEKQAPIVLVADDDDISRALICEVLDKSGFSVVQAENGVVAVDVAHQHEPDLVLLDVMMPELDGCTTILCTSIN